MFARNATADREVCGVMGCEQPARVRGLCSACYSYWRNHREKTIAQEREYIWRTKRLVARIPVLIGVRKSTNPHWGAPAEKTEKDEQSHGRQSIASVARRPRSPLEAGALDSGIVTHRVKRRAV